MIAYFDTSAVVPLIINEASTELCNRVWNESSRVVSVRLLYPQARAALATAARLGRVTRPQLAAAVGALDAIITEVDHIEVTADLAPERPRIAPARMAHLRCVWMGSARG